MTRNWKHMTPRAFFDILEIDREIGWTNPKHVETRVFYWKALKVIKDEEVSFK